MPIKKSAVPPFVLNLHSYGQRGAFCASTHEFAPIGEIIYSLGVHFLAFKVCTEDLREMEIHITDECIECFFATSFSAKP
jgi:hypothetical protein